MSDKRRMMDIMALCTTAMEDEEKRGGDPKKAAILVNCTGMKRAGAVYRLFPTCPRGKVVKRFQARGKRFFAVKYNAEKLRDALVEEVKKISGMVTHFRKEEEAKQAGN